VLQKCFQSESASVHQNKNVPDRKLDKRFDGETEGWLVRTMHEVLACLLEDVEEYVLPDELVDELLVCVTLLHSTCCVSLLWNRIECFRTVEVLQIAALN
jgi:hypothetical protein